MHCRLQTNSLTAVQVCSNPHKKTENGTCPASFVSRRTACFVLQPDMNTELNREEGLNTIKSILRNTNTSPARSEIGPESKEEILNRLNEMFKDRMKELNSWYFNEVTNLKNKSDLLINNDKVFDMAEICDCSNASTEWTATVLQSPSTGSVRCDQESPNNENMATRYGSKSYSPARETRFSSTPIRSTVTPCGQNRTSARSSPNQTCMSSHRPSFFTSPNLPEDESGDCDMPSYLNTWCKLANVWGGWCVGPTHLALCSSQPSFENRDSGHYLQSRSIFAHCMAISPSIYRALNAHTHQAGDHVHTRRGSPQPQATHHRRRIFAAAAVRRRRRAS